MVTALLLSCFALMAEARSPQEAKALEDFYASPATQLGSSKDGVIKSIGKPRAIEETPGENESKTYKITFKEAEVLILHSPNTGNESWIIHSRLKRSFRKLKLPIRIGTPAKRVIDLFGAPTTGGAGRERVTEIEWSQYLD